MQTLIAVQPMPEGLVDAARYEAARYPRPGIYHDAGGNQIFCVYRLGVSQALTAMTEAAAFLAAAGVPEATPGPDVEAILLRALAVAVRPELAGVGK